MLEGVPTQRRHSQLAADIVDERKQAGNRPKAARNRPAHVTRGPKRLEMTARFAEHGHVGVTKSVNRLLAIPDDEDRWLKRAGVRDAGALSPRLDQQRHELPLRPARVLELVDEDVVITRLEAVAALGELLHLPEEVERTKQHLREVEDGVGFEGSPVLGLLDGKHPSDTTRDQHVEIA